MPVDTLPTLPSLGRPAVPPTLALHCHSATPCARALTVTVGVGWSAGGCLVLNYRIEGDVDGLRLPPRRPPAAADSLWQSTCFEAFVKAPRSRGYTELNASPSSQWALYRFDGYRRGMRALAPAHPPQMLCRRQAGTVHARVEVDLAELGVASRGELEMAIAAVLQDVNGGLSYWALTHPAGEPDFHHPSAFTLVLARPSA